MKKTIYTVLGFISFGLGGLGVFLPFLPTVPFLLFATYCFARSSEKLNQWFISTQLYKNHIETYVQGKGMTLSTKLRIMFLVTLLLSIGFIMMSNVQTAQFILIIVWACHAYYFLYKVKTIPKNNN